MTITISMDYGVRLPQGRTLGYMGENKLRTVKIFHPKFDGAVYILKILYSDGIIYEVPVENGIMTVDGSLLRYEGEVTAQFYAYVNNGNEEILVFQTEKFSLEIGGQIDGEVTAIPTYEQSRDMLEKLISTMNNTSTPSPAAIQIDSAVPASLIDVSLSGTAYPLTADNWDFFQNGEVGGCEFGDGYMRLYSNVIVGYAWTFLQSAVRVDLTGVNSIVASVRTKAGTQYNTYLAVAENTVEGSEKTAADIVADGGLMNARTACAKSDDRQIVTLDVSGLSGYHYIEIIADCLTEIYVYDLRLQ